jgi:putative oxidoreductase
MLETYLEYIMFTNLANTISRFLYRQSVGLLVLRLVTGTIFILHGAFKIAAMPLILGFFASLGLTPAEFWVWFISLVEITGGVALILGVATRFFGAVLAIEMLVAIILTGIGRGWAAHEFEILLMAASVAIAFAGSGRWSLYKMECGRCGGILCRGDTCVLVTN